MFCNKCGCQLEENTAFCTNCGSAVEMQGSSQNAEVNQETGFKQPQKKKMGKKKKVGIISVTAVIVLIAGTITAMACAPSFAALIGKAFPGFSNFIMKTFAPADNYMDYVVQTSLKSGKASEPIVKFAGRLKSENSYNAENTGKIKVVLGDGLKDLIKTEADTQTAAAVDWIDNMSVDYSVAFDDTKLGCDLGMGINDTDIVSADMILDMKNGVLYMTIPEFSEQSVKIDLGSQLSSEEIEMLHEFLELIPDEKVLERIVDKYIECVFEELKADSKKSDKLTAGGVTQKTTRVTVKINEKTLLNVAKAVLKESKSNKDIQNLIKNTANSELVGGNGDEVYSSFVSSIDELLSELGDVKASSAVSVNLYFWVNNKSEIIGIGGGMTGIAEAKFYTTENGSKYGTLFSVDADGQSIKLEGSGTIANGKKNGSFDFSIANANILNIKTENVDVKKEQEGIFDGKVTLQASNDIGDLLSMIDADKEIEQLLKSVKIELTGSENTVGINLYQDNKLFAGAEVSATQSEGKASVDIPKNYTNLGTNGTYSFERNLETWSSMANPNKILDNIKKAGAPSSLFGGVNMTQQPAAETEFEDFSLQTASGF